MIKEADEVLPKSENVEKYEKVYEVYKSLYGHLKTDFVNLNKIF